MTVILLCGGDSYLSSSKKINKDIYIILHRTCWKIKGKQLSFKVPSVQIELIISIITWFNLPLSQQAHSQMLQLQTELPDIQMNDSSYRWVYIWNSNQFSDRKAYNHMSGHLTLHPVYKWLWSCSCQNKHKVFFWLLIKDRLSTRELLRRKNMALQDYN